MPAREAGLLPAHRAALLICTGSLTCRDVWIGGEAALQSVLAIKDTILVVAAVCCSQAARTSVEVVDRATGAARMALAELLRIVYSAAIPFRAMFSRLVPARHYTPKQFPTRKRPGFIVGGRCRNRAH